MEGTDSKIDVKVVLEGDVAKQFLAIKRLKGLSQNTEVMRAVIADFFREHESVLSRFYAEVCGAV